MRVLLCVHHGLDPDLGAPGVTLALGSALEREGCQVAYHSFDQAYGELGEERVGHQLRFPWHAGSFLVRHAGAHDVVDASTGDAWVWATAGRPRARATALVTRAHGLEHVAHERDRRHARERGERLSWKYPLYHGGLRLWEVARSLRLADQCILLNGYDRDYVRDRLAVPGERLNVIPNGIGDHFHAAQPAEPVDGPVRAAFVGRWSAYKGSGALVEAVGLLAERGVPISLTLLGTVASEAEVLADLPAAVRERTRVEPAFQNERLPGLLGGHELFIFPSLSEGSSASLLEAMACGLAPVATAVGSAPEIVDEHSGVLVEPGDAAAIAEAIVRLAADRSALLGMRRSAQDIARGFRWPEVARRTLDVYERAIAARSTASRKRGPTLSQV